MSTRRSARTASKVGSSRGASPAISEQDIPTSSPSARRTARRATASTPLPAVGLRTSTAYGTNSMTQPNSMKGPETHDQINNVLVGLLDPVREEPPPSDTGSRHGGSRAGRGGRRGGSAVAAPPPPDRSFMHESGIFGSAGLESSSFAEESDLGAIPEEPVDNQSVLESTDLQNQRPLITEIARNTRVEYPSQETSPAAPAVRPSRAVSKFFSNTISKFADTLLAMFSYVISLMNWIRVVVLSTQGKSTIVAVILAIALFKVLSETSFETPIRWYGTLDFSHNVGQFIPYSVSHPLSALKDNDIRDFERRLTAAEYDIAHLKVRTNLDSEAISQLEKALPDTIVCKQDGLGKLQIPDNFWHALQDKIRSDNALLERQFTEKETKAIVSTSLSKKEVISIAQKQAEQVLHKSNTKNWEKFLNDNRALIVSWTGDEFDKQTDSLRRDVLTSKSEFLELIEQNWADTKDEIQKELSPQMKTLDLIRNRVTQLEKKVTGATKDEIRAIAVDVSKNLISGAQLGSLANANLKVNVKHGLRRLNHFSPGTGAVINPKLTSSNFVFPSMRHNMLSKLLRSLVYRPIPVPNPPEFALSRWEEHGECWCSPLNSNEGLWPTLGVIVSNDIYPDQVVVEHIPMTASLEPGSAPKEMELWVYIEDPVTRAAIESRTMDFFHTEKDPRNLVQIGSWTYDTESMQDIQSFPLQIDLKMFEGRSYTNNLVVRVTSNWGGDRVNYACLYRVRVNGKVAEQKA